MKIDRGERRRCRAQTVYNAWSGFSTQQCGFIATRLRELPPERRELPVCGTHARSASASEYRPIGPSSLAVEAVVR